jgi:hypothetical protein
MRVSMASRLTLAAALLFAVAACGGEAEPPREVRLLAPAGVAADPTRFERATGCRVDLRVYDGGEDVQAIARRRDADVVAGPAPPGAEPHFSQDLVRIAVASGLEITIPRQLAAAFAGVVRPAGRRSIVWRIRAEGENDGCARRWLAYATSRSGATE